MMTPEEVCARLGIPKRRLCNLRKQLRLQPDDHWTIGADARQVFYTDAGVEALRKALELPECHDPTSTTPGTEKRAAAGNPAKDAGHMEEMTVASYPRPWADGTIRHVANPRIILARRDNGDIVPVRVAQSGNFCPVGRDGRPMTITAAFGGDPGHWFLVGRCPRYLGRF